MHIYLVDDDIFCLSLYQQFMANLGYKEVSLFNNGEDCLQELAEDRPELAIVDYNMEGLNGIEVLKRIKAYDKSILVYIISGKEDPMVAAEATREGALEYVVKSSLSPEKVKELMEKAEKWKVPGIKAPKKSFFEKVKARFT